MISHVCGSIQTFSTLNYWPVCNRYKRIDLLNYKTGRISVDFNLSTFKILPTHCNFIPPAFSILFGFFPVMYWKLRLGFLMRANNLLAIEGIQANLTLGILDRDFAPRELDGRIKNRPAIAAYGSFERPTKREFIWVWTKAAWLNKCGFRSA